MMSVLSEHLLTIIILLPIVGITVIAFIKNQTTVFQTTLGITLLDLLASLYLWSKFDQSVHGMQFVERVLWMPTFNTSYSVGVDGISLLLVILTTLLTPLCVLCSWNNLDRNPKTFMILLLLVEAAMLAVFTTLYTLMFFM